MPSAGRKEKGTFRLAGISAQVHMESINRCRRVVWSPSSSSKILLLSMVRSIQCFYVVVLLCLTENPYFDTVQDDISSCSGGSLGRFHWLSKNTNGPSQTVRQTIGFLCDTMPYRLKWSVCIFWRYVTSFLACYLHRWRIFAWICLDRNGSLVDFEATFPCTMSLVYNSYHILHR